MSKRAGNTAAGDPAGSGFAGEAEQTEHILSISVVARMFKISSFWLWLYEWRGFIRRQRLGNQRVYSWSDCERIAVLVKARKAGLSTGQLGPMLKAMDEKTAPTATDIGRLTCLALIHDLESRQQAIGNALGELYRIDWELSRRLGVKDAGGVNAPADRD